MCSRTYTHTEADHQAAPAPFTLHPCAMSRGRGGPYKEHYHRHPPPDFQAKESYYRPRPASFYPRAGPQQHPYSSYYNSPARPVVQPSPAPSLIPSAPPVPKHNNVAPQAEAFNNTHNQNHGSNPGPNSFQYQQAEFLRGQSSEAPQFRNSPRGGGGGVVPDRRPGSSYHPPSGYNRYSYPNSSPRGRGGYSQDQGFVYAGAPQGTPGPRHLNQNQLPSTNHNQYSNRPWQVQTDSVCDRFQSLSLQHRDRPSRGGERFGRHSASSSSSFPKVNITLTPDIQDQVHRALAALKSSESICAKFLAKKLHLPKKIVNKALYSLERSQKAFKQGDHPPEWSLYREALRGEEDQTCKVQNPPSHLCVSSGHPPEPEAKVELKTETAENRGQVKEEDSDTESSSSYCSSSESSDSEESQSPAKGHPSTTSSPHPELALPMMADQKDVVLQYLLASGEATALSIAKNLGLRSANKVNPTLYALEKQGEVIKNSEVNPPTWELSDRRRERMERSLKAAKSTVKMEEEPSLHEMGGGSAFLPSSPLPPIPGLEPLPLPEGWMPEQSHSEAVGHIFVLSIY